MVSKRCCSSKRPGRNWGMATRIFRVCGKNLQGWDERRRVRKHGSGETMGGVMGSRLEDSRCIRSLSDWSRSRSGPLGGSLDRPGYKSQISNGWNARDKRDKRCSPLQEYDELLVKICVGCELRCWMGERLHSLSLHRGLHLVVCKSWDAHIIPRKCALVWDLQ